MTKTYINTSFTGHYPVGTAAAVRAESQTEAAEILNNSLESSGLARTAKAEDMVRFPARNETCRILLDGNY